MKIVRFMIDDVIQYGIKQNKTIYAIEGTPFDCNWNSIMPVVTGAAYKEKDVSLLAPCEPSKYVGVGLNYLDSIRAMCVATPQTPVLFLKPSTAIIGNEEAVVYPAGDEPVDLAFEGELAIVIKKKCFRIEEDQAGEYILGYTVTNDVTDMEKMGEIKEGNSVRLKACDTFAPIGPYIETDLDPNNLRIRTWVNRKLAQDGNTKDLIFKPNWIVSYISKIMTLLPGDIIATGTPKGARVVSPDDTVKIEIEGIGTLSNIFKFDPARECH